MAKRSTNPRNSGRVKPKKVADPKASPFKKELENNRKNKSVLFGVILIVVVMIGSMIVPYLGGQAKNYTLPVNALKSEEAVSKENSTFNIKEISLGQSFNQIDKEYYVLYGSTTDLTTYSGQITRATLYTVDKDKFVNKSLSENISSLKTDESYDDSGNLVKTFKVPTDVNSIKISSGVALIKIKNGKAVEFYATKAEVEKQIKKIK